MQIFIFLFLAWTNSCIIVEIHKRPNMACTLNAYIKMTLKCDIDIFFFKERQMYVKRDYFACF